MMPVKKQIKRKKGSAEVISLIGLVITVAVVGILALIFMSWMHNYDSRQQVNQVVDKYLLAMQSQGYLEDTGRNSIDEMKNELMNVGLYDVNITQNRSKTNPAGNGEEVVLSVTGNLEILQYGFQNVFNLSQQTQRKQVTVRRASTSLASDNSGNGP